MFFEDYWRVVDARIVKKQVWKLKGFAYVDFIIKKLWINVLKEIEKNYKKEH